jgi:hypothetical protein
MSKEIAPGFEIGGKTWDCSLNLKRKDWCTIEVDSHVQKMLNHVTTKFPDAYKELERAWLWKLTPEMFAQYVTGSIAESFNAWKKSISHPETLRVTKSEPRENANYKGQDQIKVTKQQSQSTELPF